MNNSACHFPGVVGQPLENKLAAAKLADALLSEPGFAKPTDEPDVGPLVEEPCWFFLVCDHSVRFLFREALVARSPWGPGQLNGLWRTISGGDGSMGRLVSKIQTAGFTQPTKSLPTRGY